MAKSKKAKLKKLQAQRIRSEAAVKAKKRQQRKQIVPGMQAPASGQSSEQSAGLVNAKSEATSQASTNQASQQSTIGQGSSFSEEKAAKKPRVSVAEFVRQVRKEAIRRVTWPKRQEVVLGTVMVLIAASIVATFFLVLDSIFSYLVRLVF